MTPEHAEGVSVVLDGMEPRTFPIRYHNEKGECLTGTAFVVERGGHEYLVTAHHVVNGITARGWVELFREGQWKDEVFARVGTGNALEIATGIVDVAVLKLGGGLIGPGPITTSSAGLAAGQGVWAIGFPASQASPPAVNVEIGTFTGFDREGRLLIKGKAGTGMSGGPVVFSPEGQPPGELRIAGILAHIPSSPCSVPLPPTVVACDIRYAIELIDANPLGQ